MNPGCTSLRIKQVPENGSGAHALCKDAKHSIGNGFYFALPTMATSNGMYERIQNVHRKFYDGDTTPSLILTHGASHLHRGFQASLLPKVTSSTTDLGEYDEQQSVHGELGHSSSISACSVDGGLVT